MEKFDLENFPTSKSARKMLSYVSDGFYDKSYVGKWIYQVMGIEYDAALEIVEALPEQFFPETATWGLMFHEIKWGLPVRENLSYEERRRLIYQRRDCRAPMTPYWMEKYLQNITGFEVHIADINDSGEYGFVAPHPNMFKAYFLGEESLDSKLVHEILDRFKQSHTTYTVNERIEIEVNNRNLEQIIFRNIQFKMGIPFWYEYVYDGMWLLDGSVLFDVKRRYGLQLGVSNRVKIKNEAEDIRLHSLSTNWIQHLQENIVARTIYCFVADFWGIPYLNGEYLLNGEILLDAVGYKGKAALTLRLKMNAVNLEAVENFTVETKSGNYWFLDGVLPLDGTRNLNSIYRKEVVE